MDNNKQIIGFTMGIAQATAKLNALMQHLDDHCNLVPDDVTWGDVGNIQNVNAHLDDILDFLDITVKDALAAQEAK